MTEEKDLDSAGPLDVSGGALTEPMRLERVQSMTDAELKAFQLRLAHPDVNDNVWTPLIEAELRRRGLLPLN